MPNPKKKKTVQNTPVPIFTTALNYISENIFEKNAAISVPRSEIAQKLDFYKKKAAVPNTVKATQNWMKKSKYKAKTIKQAIDGINRFISKNSAIRGFNLHNKYQFLDLHDILNSKMKDLQKKGLEEKEGSIALTAQQVKKIFTQILQDANVSEDTIMNITEHKSLQGVYTYKSVNESQKINTIKTLINSIEPNQEPSTVLTEITRFHINFNTNTVTNTQDVNMVQDQIYKEFQNQ
ncbi:27471_t:CDS:2, partial [Racocetra persica]